MFKTGEQQHVYIEEPNNNSIKSLGTLFLKFGLGTVVFVGSFLVIFFLVKINYGNAYTPYVLFTFAGLGFGGALLVAFIVLSDVILKTFSLASSAVTRHDFVDAVGDTMRGNSKGGGSDEKWLAEVTKFALTSGNQNLKLIDQLLEQELSTRNVDTTIDPMMLDFGVDSDEEAKDTTL